jgi:hypothetical protein
MPEDIPIGVGPINIDVEKIHIELRGEKDNEEG